MNPVSDKPSQSLKLLPSLQAMKTREFEDETVVVKEGDMGDEFFIIQVSQSCITRLHLHSYTCRLCFYTACRSLFLCASTCRLCFCSSCRLALIHPHLAAAAMRHRFQHTGAMSHTLATPVRGRPGPVGDRGYAAENETSRTEREREREREREDCGR